MHLSAPTIGIATLLFSRTNAAPKFHWPPHEWKCKTLSDSTAIAPETTGLAEPSNIAASVAAAQVESSPLPYYFPDIEKAPSAGLFPILQCNGVTIEEATIDTLQQYMASGQLTATTLVRCYVERATQVDRYVNSILELNPDYLEIAAQLDAERALGLVRGPLHGIPFLVKDNIASKDKMETTAGSWALLGSIVPRDAFVVSKLREAGALLLGKATLSEWADMRSSNYSEGYSGRGYQARSAYNFTVNPGGSSSGSAISVACNIVPFSLGTETDGSVINPAERNSIVGIKPTVGLTSRAGVIPESEHQDTVGSFGKTVKDAVYALDAIYGVDPRDNYTFAQTGNVPRHTVGYTQFLADSSALAGARFGIPWRTFWALADSDQLDQLVQLVDLIESAGATIVNNTELPDADLTVSPAGWDWTYGCERGYTDQCEFTVVKVDFYNNIQTYLSELTNTDIRTLQDIVDYNSVNTGTEGGTPGIQPAFGSGQDQFLESLVSCGTRDATYYDALNWTRSTTRWQIETALDVTADHGRPLDALLIPTDVAQAPQVAAQAGFPIITLPAGVHAESHMPFGLGLLNVQWSEDKLIRWASAIEDLQRKTDTPLKRQLPEWHGYQQRNLPVINEVYVY